MRDTVEMPRITTKPLVQTYATRDVPRGADWDQNFKDYVEAIRKCAEACGAAGVKMSVEPHPALGINFDPSHTFPVGDFPNISVYRLNKNIIHVHASDNDAVTNVHWRPGMGKIDWKAMFEALKEVGYDGVVSIELEDVPGVSRGPNSNAPGVFRNVTATDEFVAESVAGMDYLKGICREVGINVEE